ncbi:hypothetical protein [Burkholderia sp. Ac-20365]|uniref:hypothetical protein n=1 Tax=Burkholderia sp. Ac-20365 TaxID=2703897 RepID=UPI00197B6DC1|nr:hypothetical protein [Burkholderia sp. Ac-20365]MBN3760586.1 hypothetical protein [Burkholderia sp. Ac-20365]
MRGYYGCIAALTLVATFARVSNAASTRSDEDEHWQFAVAPYLWLPSVDGTMRFSLPGGGADASTGPYDYLQNLKFAFMIQGEARKGDWSFFGDGVYLNFGRHESAVNATTGLFGPGETQQSVQTSFRGTLVEIGGGHTVMRPSWGYVDAIVGMRYLGAKGTLDATTASTTRTGGGANRQFDLSQVQNIFDGFAGVRGRLSITESGRWYVPFYLDVGAGTSKFTWQAMAGLGYAMKWGDVSLTYRYLAFYGSGDQLVQTLRFGGPSLNLIFRF